MAPGNPIKKYIKAATNYVANKAARFVHRTVKSAIRGAKNQIRKTADNYEFEAKTEMTFTGGLQAGFEFNELGGDINLGSVEITKITLGVNISTKGMKNISNIEIAGQNDKMKFTQSASLGLIAGGEVKREGTLDLSGNDIKVSTDKVEMSSSISLGISNVSFSGTQNSNGSTEEKLSVGGASSGAFILGGSISVSSEIKHTEKNN